MTIIPAEALKNHIAILGKTGSGKTSTEKLLVERVVADGFRVCILDSIKSDWWGITSSANGKSPGLPFKILGGPRGHVPLHSSAGTIIGQLVGSGKLPLSIIDMADFEAGGLQRFFVDFAQSLMRSARGVVYLVIEEAHEFAPKERSGIGGESMAMHWAKKLATAGRSKGIRLVVATQRIQALHNAVLGSCETIVAHRLSAPADQEPVVKWLKANTDKETEAKVSSSLSSLPTGTGWVCCGEAKLFEMVKFPKFKTYDNTATPVGDSEEITVKTAPVDQDELRAIIGEAVAEADANDLNKLKAEIRELRKRVAAPAAVASVDPKAVERARQDGFATGYDQACVDYEERYIDAVVALQVRLQQAIDAVKLQRPKAKAKPLVAVRAAPSTASTIRVGGSGSVSTAAPAAEGLTAPQQKIIDAIAFWTVCGTPSASRHQVAGVAGYKPGSGNFNNILGQLSASGAITYPAPGFVSITKPDLANQIDHTDAKGRFLATLNAPQRKIIDAFNGSQASREEIAERSNYAPSSGNFNNILGSLSTIGIVTRPAPGMVDLADWVRELL